MKKDSRFISVFEPVYTRILFYNITIVNSYKMINISNLQ